MFYSSTRVSTRWVNPAAHCWVKLLSGNFLIYKPECDVEWGLVSLRLHDNLFMCSVDVRVSEDTTKRHFLRKNIKSVIRIFADLVSVDRPVDSALQRQLMLKRSQTVCGGCTLSSCWVVLNWEGFSLTSLNRWGLYLEGCARWEQMWVFTAECWTQRSQGFWARMLL